MKTKKELLDEPSTVKDIQDYNAPHKDMMFVIAESLIDIRDTLVQLNQHLRAIRFR